VLTVARIGLVTDANHDRKINDFDRTLSSTNVPFRFWLNDDEDDIPVASDAEKDQPGRPNANWKNAQVDGVRDLIDFFPAFLDITNLLQYVNPTSLTVRLKHPDSALQFCDAGLSMTNAGSYLANTNDAERLSHAPVTQITSTGVVLPVSFLTNLLSTGKGVVLIEGRTNTTQSLELEIRDAATDELLYRRFLRLSLSGVEDMFRHKDRRPAEHAGLDNVTKTPCVCAWRFLFATGGARGTCGSVQTALLVGVQCSIPRDYVAKRRGVAVRFERC
jgi:hypothetical protein